MQWLVSQMWIALAAAGFLGLLFGMALRGLFGTGKIRRAQVDRDVAKTELEQTRSELDELYAAQRKRQGAAAQAVSGDDSLMDELAKREAKITGLGEELAAARSEMDTLKVVADKARDNGGNLAGKAGAALAGAAAGAMLGGDDEASKQLEERNRWLEERVTALEGDLSAVTESAAGDAATDSADGEPVEGDEEVARLRWRNRYLEGRLAYFEEGSDGAAAEGDDGDGGMVAAAAGAALAGGAALLAGSKAEAVEAAGEEVAEKASEAEEAVLDKVEEAVEEVADTEEVEADAEAKDAAEEAVETEESVAETAEPAGDDAEQPEAPVAADAGDDGHPSEAVLKDLDDEQDGAGEAALVQPDQMDAPAEGGGDDLMAINGVGPRIGEVLNELGIWSYAQIAVWTPENEAWIEQHLSFKGRVAREGWIEQAKTLMAGAEGEAD